MPEGDTIRRTATALHRALAGREVRRVELPRGPAVRPFPAGTVVDGVDAAGKHCLVRFSDGRTLRTHLGMHGSWHLYRPGERWRRPAGTLRALVEVPDLLAVCFSAPVAELTAAAVAGAAVSHLGPDLCSPGADLDEAARRLVAFSAPDRPVGEALLDQRIAAGIGNVYKSEACFARGVHPFTPVGALPASEHRALLAAARDQLVANLDTNRRATVAGGLAVYGRRGRPCRRCGTPIAWAAQGEHRRGTYWCPTCQPAPVAPVPSG